MSDFITMCLQGRALVEEVDDFVEKWHKTSADVSLAEYLGMTKLEYKLWVADSGVLPYIITAHRNNKNVSDLLETIQQLPLAARAGNPQSAIKLLQWLKSKGLTE